MNMQTNSASESCVVTKLAQQLLERFPNVDGAIITATHPDLSQAENHNRNSELFAALYASHFSMTPVKYAEGYTFVVANTVQHTDFFKTICQLGKRYSQSNVLLIRANSDKSAATFCDIHNEKTIDNAKMDSELLQQLAETQFAFECKTQAERMTVWLTYEYAPGNWLGRWACTLKGKEILQSLLGEQTHENRK